MSFHSTEKEKLFEHMKSVSFKQGEFTLSSGKKSDFYINVKKALIPWALTAIPQQMQKVIALSTRLNIAGVGGLTMGADPLAVALALVGRNYGANYVPFYVRKEPKGHG